ncbi:MAG TPA: galactokinase [Candidatus Dormibacteraeota bacterium]|nr:galactokinase [Candidatus Dormibacteraeota bacterium]
MRARRARDLDAVAAFRRLADAQPDGVWAAPGRVNLVGEHTDYSGGMVLPVAIDRSVVVAARLREDDVVGVASLQMPGEVRVSLGDIQPGRSAGWTSYPLGTLWALQRAGLTLRGIDLLVDSDIPLGAGLASSAGLEVATALAFTELTAQQMTRLELALCCQAGENAVAGAPTGVMDQVTVLLGRAGHALLVDCRTLDSELVPWLPGDASLALLVIDTAVRHANSGPGYRSRRDQCAQAAAALGVETLRDATAGSVARTLSGVLQQRARHVVTENHRVVELAGLLRAGRIADTGPLFDASHASLRDDYEVSCAELDVAVETARGAGAIGARMTGGGFGGCAIALVHIDSVDAVSAAVETAFAQRGYRPPRMFPVVTAGGAHRLA